MRVKVQSVHDGEVALKEFDKVKMVKAENGMVEILQMPIKGHQQLIFFEASTRPSIEIVPNKWELCEEFSGAEQDYYNALGDEA